MAERTTTTNSGSMTLDGNSRSFGNNYSNILTSPIGTWTTANSATSYMGTSLSGLMNNK